tara:strand:- start:10831 stop:11841 length:1011 start_codon:yes stop_codon:yes gene_type:complete
MTQTGSISLTINNNVITRATGSFISDGFQVGDTITLFQSSNNTGTYSIRLIDATTITTVENITDESSFTGVVLTSGEKLWNNSAINYNITSDNTSSIQHFVFLNLGARDGKGLTEEFFATNRIGLKADSVGITTSKTVPTVPIPGVAAITGEAQSLALDLGMASKSINISGTITDQFITKEFKKTTGLEKNPSVYMTAFEIAQLIHSHADSSGLQKYQTMNEIVILMPSRVDGRYNYHSSLAEAQVSNPTEFTSIEDLPLIPFNYKVRSQDNRGSIYQFYPDTEDGKPFTNFPSPIHAGSKIKGVKGFIRSFNSSITAGLPYITFTLDFEVAAIIG